MNHPPRTAPPPSRITIGVMGSHSDEHSACATPLGELLAGLKVNLLTGAGPGAMTSVSRSYTEAKERTEGICIGIVPCDKSDRSKAKTGYPNQYIELPIYTHLHLSGKDGDRIESRNHINVLTADAVIALPGGEGTQSEVKLALTYNKPVMIYASDLSLVAAYTASHFQNVPRTTQISEVETWLKHQIARVIAKQLDR